MKVKTFKKQDVEHVTFWCAGCGQFHVLEAKFWNGDKDVPTIQPSCLNTSGDVSSFFIFGECSVAVQNGTVHWSKLSTHRLAGKSLPMQHEEAWRDGGHNWSEVKPVPETKT